SVNPSDDPIAEFCQREGLHCYRGDENDVLDRFYHAAQSFHPEAIIRLTADCPLIDPEIIDRVVEAFQTGKYDYVSNTVRYTYPDGLDTEVFSFAALERAWKEARKSSE